MRKIVLLLAGLLLILGRAAWIDVALAEKSEPSKAGSEKADFEGWKYPGSKELGSGQGAGGFHAMLTTTDGLDKVESFYERKTGQKLKPDQAGGHGIGGGEGEAHVLQDDSIQPGVKGGPRPVVVRVFVQRAKGHNLTLVISRAKGEDDTHIALTYFPSTAGKR